MNEVTEKYKRMIERFECDFILEMERPYFYNISELLKEKNKKLMKDVELLRDLSCGLKYNNLEIVEVDKRKKVNIIGEICELGYLLKEEKENKIIFVKEKVELFINLKEKYFFKEEMGNSAIITYDETKLINKLFEILEKGEKDDN